MMEQKGKREPFCCPYCDEEVRAADFPWCRACGLNIAYCPNCRKPVDRDKKVCPHCGAEIKG